MGLSRNKVAVSEGAAGSPPFYGELGNRTAQPEKNNRREGKSSLSNRKGDVIEGGASDWG